MWLQIGCRKYGIGLLRFSMARRVELSAFVDIFLLGYTISIPWLLSLFLFGYLLRLGTE